jgi:hypothetical protein
MHGNAFRRRRWLKIHLEHLFLRTAAHDLSGRKMLVRSVLEISNGEQTERGALAFIWRAMGIGEC